MPRLKDLSYQALDLPLLEPFGIATGAQHVASNVVVELELDDGTVGLGEAAPVQHISGETRADVLRVLAGVRAVLSGVDLSDYRRVCAALRELLGEVPSAQSAVELALFDALARSRGLSLRSFFGGAEEKLPIDVTITTGSAEQARASASRFAGAGFETLKVKIGGSSLDQDVARLVAISDAAPDAALILDGNTAFTPGQALQLLRELGSIRKRVVLFEQPVSRDDFEGLREVETESGIPVAADESLRSQDDLRRILSTGGISAVNVKTAKLGILGSWDILVAAQAAGLVVMVGGMVESEISMSASACLAAGVGGVRYADLDTPLFLGARPIGSELGAWGPVLQVGRIRSGHGASLLRPRGGAPLEDRS